MSAAREPSEVARRIREVLDAGISFFGCAVLSALERITGSSQTARHVRLGQEATLRVS
jgi:hypothetical protein